MSESQIESVKPILTVIDDEGDLVLSSTGPRGKAMAQGVLALASGVRKITIITDGEMKVMKRNGGAAGQAESQPVKPLLRSPAQSSNNSVTDSPQPDIQDQFVDDLAAGRTGELATGEQASPTPGPSDPVPPPTTPPRRRPQIFQDAAAPPAPELAEAEMAALIAEAAQADAAASQLAEDQRFQRQQAVQAGGEADPTGADPADPATASPARRRTPRNLATTGQPCGNCHGQGQSFRVGSDGSPIMDEHGRAMSGVCQVCSGSGQIKAWGRTVRR